VQGKAGAAHAVAAPKGGAESGIEARQWMRSWSCGKLFDVAADGLRTGGGNALDLVNDVSFDMVVTNPSASNVLLLPGMCKIRVFGKLPY